MQIEIKQRFTNNVMYACDAANLMEAVERAVKEKADLTVACLRGADLRGACLRGADLTVACLRGADLRGACLRGADLGGACLRGADLRGADLTVACLRGADLRGACLGVACLRGADLRGADLRGATIEGEKIKISPLSISGLHWEVLITDGYMRIGCQRHSHSEWAAFDDAAIAAMASNAAEFWAKNKLALMAMCASHAAKALKS